MNFGRRLRKLRRCRRHHARHQHLENGNSYRILGYRGLNYHFRRKLLNLGLLRGEDFKVIGRAPLGDPIEIKINDYRLSIRADEAYELILEEIKK